MSTVNKQNLHEKLSQLKHARMSRQTAVNRLRKCTVGSEHIEDVLDMYQSFTKKGMNVMHPNEALSNVKKYGPIVQQLSQTFAPNHPLTAYYRMISTMMIASGKGKYDKNEEKSCTSSSTSETEPAPLSDQ